MKRKRKSLFLHSDGTSTIVDGRTNYKKEKTGKRKMPPRMEENSESGCPSKRRKS